jgi:hypothetical protein
MIPEEINDLMNRELDGENSPAESDRLREVISSDKAALAAFDQLRVVHAGLTRIPVVAPPATLFPNIMKALPGTRVPASAGENSIRSFIAALKWPTIARFGYAFAGGFAAGLLLFLALTGPRSSHQVPDADLVGTIANQSFPSALSTGENFHVQDEAIEGSVESRWGSGICLIHMDLKTRGEARISVSFDPTAVRVAAVRPADRSQTSLVVREGEIIATGEMSQPLDMVFSARNTRMPPAEIQIVAGGKTAVSSSVKLQPSVP